MYQITFARSAGKELQALQTATAERILDKIAALAETPRPRGARKLRGNMKLWRIRIGEYRIIYEVDDANQFVDIILIRHRSEAYR